MIDIVLPLTAVAIIIVGTLRSAYRDQEFHEKARQKRRAEEFRKLHLAEEEEIPTFNGFPTISPMGVDYGPAMRAMEAKRQADMAELRKQLYGELSQEDRAEYARLEYEKRGLPVPEKIQVALGILPGAMIPINERREQEIEPIDESAFDRMFEDAMRGKHL